MNNVGEANPQLRSCGGHIHVGYTNPDDNTSEMLIRCLDLYLGVPSILLDNDTERRKLYGKAGAFRFKDYGIEYRTLSNFWIQSEELVNWAWNNTMSAIDYLNKGNILCIEYNEDIVKCINRQDIESAKEIIEKYKIQLPELTKQLVEV